MKQGSVWLSFALLWSGYALIYAGYVWIRGYDLTFRQIVSPVNYYQGGAPGNAGNFSSGGLLPTASS